MKATAPIVLLLTFGIGNHLYGQFTQSDLLTSIDKTTFYLYSSHDINDVKTLNLTNLGFFEYYSSKENQDFSEAGVQPTLFWNLSESVSVGPSIYYNSVAGFSQRISTKYVSQSEKLLLVLVPTVGHAEKEGKIYTETFAQFQFNVPLKESMSFRVNGQFLNAWKPIRSHSRSFQQIRAGLSQNSHQFGAALDLDHYGPDPINTNSIGLYYRRTF